MKKLALSTVIFLAACSGPQGSQTSQQQTMSAPEESSPFVQKVSAAMSCSDRETQLFNLLTSDKAVDVVRDARKIRLNYISQLQSQGVDAQTIEKMNNLLESLLESASLGLMDDELSAFYTALELGFSENQDWQKRIDLYKNDAQLLWLQISQSEFAQKISCQIVSEKNVQVVPSPLDQVMTKNTAGMRLTFAAAYQSCGVLTQPRLNKGTPDLQGIAVVGTHPDGIGNKRVISDINLLLTTHPYLKSPQGNNCLDIRRQPLIYDYGGKPFAETSQINLHKNAGTGTDVLGIDCSAYVASAHLTAGLKFKSSLPLRPSQAAAYGSTNFVNPESSGLDCLGRIPVGPGGTLRDGDIIAVQGHVFMVDKVGKDPFGLLRAKTIAECANINSNLFQFEIYQSASTKGGVGLNRFEAKDYLMEAPKFKIGLERYAQEACRNRFNGVTTVPKYKDLTITRHKNTPACKAPRIPLVRESCVASCFM